VPDVITRLIETFIESRDDGERFVDTVARLGVEPFKDNVYRHITPAQRDLAAISAAPTTERRLLHEAT
jgi:dissimilatory sulfite reductase (desulfoviridin) alpha/beta subunit